MLLIPSVCSLLKSGAFDVLIFLVRERERLICPITSVELLIIKETMFTFNPEAGHGGTCLES